MRVDVRINVKVNVPVKSQVYVQVDVKVNIQDIKLVSVEVDGACPWKYQAVQRSNPSKIKVDEVSPCVSMTHCSNIIGMLPA